MNSAKTPEEFTWSVLQIAVNLIAALEIVLFNKTLIH